MSGFSTSPSPLVHPLFIELDASLSRRAGQRFGRHMQREMSRRGLITNFSGECCLVVGRWHTDWRAVRKQLVGWLAGQAAVANIVLFDPLPIERMLGDGLGLEFAVADMRETVPEASSVVIGLVLTGLITRVIFELQAAVHARPV